MSNFEPGATTWVDRLGNLRNVVRQELIRRQLAEHVPAGVSVLDIGCGQGTQAIGLARRGCTVSAVEPSAALRAICDRQADRAGVTVELLAGAVHDVPRLIGNRRFDVVCCHGVFMYLPSTTEALEIMRSVTAEDGLLSFTVRNGDAMAMRPGLRGHWDEAVSSFDQVEYINALGVDARAERLDDVLGVVADVGLTLEAWYGVRVLTDAAPVDQTPPTEATELARLLDAEEMACSRDPYRSMGSQYHIIAKTSLDTAGPES